MRKVLASEFNKDTWNTNYQDWLKLADSFCCRNQPIIHKESGKFFNILVDNLQEDERCLVCPCDAKDFDMDEFFSGRNFVCGADKDFLSPIDVLDIPNINKRAEAANLIEQKVIAIHGKMLGISLVCGDRSNWVKFVEYFDFLVKSAFLGSYSNTAAKIAFNLYAVNFSGQVVIA